MPQVTFANTVFCTVADVKGFYTNSDLLIQVSRESPDLDNRIQNHITNAKDIYLRQPLINECQKKFLTQIDSWRYFKRSQIDERISALARDIRLADEAGKFPVSGYIGYDGQFFDIIDIANFTKPGSYYNYGTPTDGTSGTYAGTAQIGDMLFDTTTDLGYINRGTLLSPLWQRFQAEDGIDFILNPKELKWTSIFATGILMAGDGMFRNRTNYQDPMNVNFSATAKAVCEGDYRSALKTAISLVNFNISGSGTPTAYELGTSNSEIVIF